MSVSAGSLAGSDCPSYNGLVAQLVERLIEDQEVVGSFPTHSTKCSEGVDGYMGVFQTSVASSNLARCSNDFIISMGESLSFKEVVSVRI